MYFLIDFLLDFTGVKKEMDQEPIDAFSYWFLIRDYRDLKGTGPGANHAIFYWFLIKSWVDLKGNGPGANQGVFLLISYSAINIIHRHLWILIENC